MNLTLAETGTFLASLLDGRTWREASAEAAYASSPARQMDQPTVVAFAPPAPRCKACKACKAMTSVRAHS